MIDIEAVLSFLPDPVSDVEQLAGAGRPWQVRYGSQHAVLRANDPARFRQLRYPPDVALSSIRWLHDFLRDLATTGFGAPAPLRDLRGDSIAVVHGVIWELLSFVPGRPMGWSDEEIGAAGQLLARFHRACAVLPPRAQRPGALMLRDCDPSHPEVRAIRDSVRRELGQRSAPRGVVHGDATQANVVIDDGAFHLVDFALAYEDALLADIGSALWRNGRRGPDALSYDAARAATFVRGYAAARPLATADAEAIVVCMKGRGLQLQHRLELRQGSDATVIQRLLAIVELENELRDAIAAAIASRY